MRIFILICMFAGLHIKLLSQAVYIYPIMGVNYFSNDWSQLGNTRLTNLQYHAHVYYGLGFDYSLKDTEYHIRLSNVLYRNESWIFDFFFIPTHSGNLMMHILDNDLLLIRSAGAGLYVGLGFKHQLYYRFHFSNPLNIEGFENWPIKLRTIGYSFYVGYEYNTIGTSLKFSRVYHYATDNSNFPNYFNRFVSFTNSNIFEASIYYKFRIAGGKSDMR